MFSFSARTIRSPGPGGRGNTVNDPEAADVMQDFESMLTNIIGGQPNARNRAFQGGPMMGNVFPFSTGPQRIDGGFGGRSIHSSTGRIWQSEPHANVQTGNIQE